MDEIVRGNRPHGSVWGIAAVAVALFIAVVLIAGMFGSADISAVTSVK